MSVVSADDPVFSRFKFYAAHPKTKLNHKRLIRSNSIYDDGSVETAAKKPSRFRQSLSTLLDNITLHCYNHILEPNRSGWEKFFWIIVHILNACFFGFIIMNQFKEISYRPLVTSLQNLIYPVQYVPFPAVAICTNNRISKKAAIEFAKTLVASDPQHRNESFFMDMIYHFSSLYDSDTDDEATVLEFQEFLEENVLINTTDLTSILRNLTPNCNEVALTCHWRGEERPCMTPRDNMTALLRSRRTQYGFCCSFNYNRIDNFTMTENLTRFESLVTGPEMSLIVLLNTSTDDYYFNLFNGPGFRILIFDENEFPDSNSGGVIEEMARPGRETFLRVDPVTVEASTNIMTYSVETRGCYYPTEWRNRYGGDYKRTTCILNCRIRSLIALCQCVPFYYYLNTYLPNQSQMPSVCTLQHVACLEKYRIKIQMVVTKIEPIIGLEREMEEALYCPECHPSCSRISYSVQSTSLPLIIQERNSTVMPITIDNVTDLAVVRVFFGKSETWLYKQDLAQYWFEIASLFGGLFGLTAGFSIISGFEIFYFIMDHMVEFVYKKIRHLLPRKILVEERLIIYP